MRSERRKSDHRLTIVVSCKTMNAGRSLLRPTCHWFNEYSVNVFSELGAASAATSGFRSTNEDSGVTELWQAEPPSRPVRQAVRQNRRQSRLQDRLLRFL